MLTTSLPPQELLRQMFAGLAAVHSAGAAHRDLKPENLYVASAPSPRSHRAGDRGGDPQADVPGAEPLMTLRLGDFGSAVDE